MNISPCPYSKSISLYVPSFLCLLGLLLTACGVTIPGGPFPTQTAHNSLPILPPLLTRQFAAESTAVRPTTTPMPTLAIQGQVETSLPIPLALISPVPATVVSTLQFLPDSEVVYSPSAVGFDVNSYLKQSGGFLRTYRQYLMITGWTSAADIIARVAVENSINPRLLLVLLENQCGCVRGQLPLQSTGEYLMGAKDYRRKDLYGQLIWAVHILSKGYYGRRGGTLKDIHLPDGTIAYPFSESNAGTSAVIYFFVQFNKKANDWGQVVSATRGFMNLYRQMFGDPWERARLVEPLIPSSLSQPSMILPFQEGKLWSFTGGPHSAWEGNEPLGALDFAPASAQSGCVQSDAWVVAASSGLVVRSEFGAVVQDLDGDGKEQTGWVILYMHIDDRDRVRVGKYLHSGDFAGHPSCKGGRATGTHLHIARKFNGEWIPASGLMPFVLSGWVAQAGERPYLGTLTRGNQVVRANQYGNCTSHVLRETADTNNLLKNR
jgi:LasA protease